MNRPLAFILSAICLVTGSCSMSGVRCITMVDERSRPVRDLTVVPIVTTSKAVGVGADGKGFGAGGERYAAKPFGWSSGENLLKEHVQTKAAIVWMFPPVALVDRKWVGKWLFLRKGCQPLILPMNEIESNSYLHSSERDPADKVFVLKQSGGRERGDLIDALLSPQPDLKLIGSYLHDSISRVELDVKSVELLRRQR